jgi:pyruvate formate-lyase activating enzyme-like uncharacterized protein
MTELQSDSAGSLYNYLSRGCEICRTGAGLVLFITGICARGCPYCPLSEERRGKDLVYANERLAEGIDDVIDEARLIGALGTGITGGEPLLKLDRVVEHIIALKEEFGPEHHIHLYTGLLPGKEVLSRLKEAGLDEIRFHPRDSDLEDPSEIKRALLESKSLGLESGVEMPAISHAPALLQAVEEADAFINLNELEFSETNWSALKAMGFSSHDLDCGAEESESIARQNFSNHGLKIHYCPSRFKDSVQLRERLKRRAERTARPFDYLTEDGTIVYGEITCSEGLNAAEDLLRDLDVPFEMFCAQDDRIEIAAAILEEISKELKGIGCNISLVERYPLEDGLVVERIPL